MEWFSKKKEIKPVWEYRTIGQVWRLIPSVNGYMIGEDRTTDTKKVSFFLVDLNTGEEHWRIRFNEEWWIGIEAVHDDYIFIHEYTSPDMPEHKKIHTVDARSGQVLWSDENLKYVLTDSGNLYASIESITHKTFVEVEIKSGKIIREIDEQFVVSIQKSRLAAASDRIKYPTTIDSEGDDPPPVQECLSSISKNNQIPAFMEIVLSNHIVTMGFYLKLEGYLGGLRQEIICYNTHTKKITFRDVINEQTSFPLSDTFLVVDSMLYYIKMKHTLTAVNIQSLL